MITFSLNGAPHEVAQGATLQELVASLSLSQQALALAVNRTVVPRRMWPQQLVQAEDQIEIVRAIGGG